MYKLNIDVFHEIVGDFIEIGNTKDDIEQQ